MISGYSKKSTIASSSLTNDFNSKKSNILTLCRKVDEEKTGFISISIFLKLLDCMDVELERSELAECLLQYCIVK